MHLIVGNSHTKVVGTEDELEFVRDLLSVTVERFAFDYYERRTTRSTAVITYLDRWNRFPSGFTRLVRDEGRTAGHVVTGESQISKLDFDPLEIDTDSLRNWQRDAVAIAMKRRRGIIKVPTGAGKTRCATEIIRCVPIDWVFLVKEKALVDNMADAWESLTGERPSTIGGKKTQINPDSRLTVASPQRLLANKENKEIWGLLTNAQGFIYDEVQSAAAETNKKVITATKNAVFRIGMSATPTDRSDNQGALAIGLTGPILYSVGYQELVADGVLPNVACHMYEYANPGKKAGRYQTGYKYNVVESADRNALLVRLCQKYYTDGPTVMMVKDIKHGTNLVTMLRRAGLSADFIDGSKDLSTRDRKINELVTGQLDVLVASKILEAGVNVPSLAVCIRASAGKSESSTIQFLGRGARIDKETGKTSFTYVDVIDTGAKWHKDHGKARLKTLSGEGHAIVMFKDATT